MSASGKPVFHGVRRFFRKLWAPVHLSGVKASPQAMAELRRLYVENGPAASLTPQPSQPRPKGQPREAYAHEQLPGAGNAVGEKRTPASFDPDRVSKSARTEKAMRAKGQADLEKGLKGNPPK